MSIQDDYFDLSAELKDWQLKALNRLWDRLCETEMDDDACKDIITCLNRELRIKDEKIAGLQAEKDRLVTTKNVLRMELSESLGITKEIG